MSKYLYINIQRFFEFSKNLQYFISMLNLLTMKKCLKKILISFAFIFTFLFAQEDNSVAADNLSEKADSNIFIEETHTEKQC